MKHHFINLFREMEEGSGGQPVFDNEKILTQMFSLEKQLNEAYNKGVDDCLKFVKMGLSHSELMDDRSAVSLLNAIIEKLEKLKSK